MFCGDPRGNLPKSTVSKVATFLTLRLSVPARRVLPGPAPTGRFAAISDAASGGAIEGPAPAASTDTVSGMPGRARTTTKATAPAWHGDANGPAPRTAHLARPADD